MKSIVAGTAGHIDHGKTALVRALTGIETDRLEEEKRRGISIDIGFANLDLSPGLRIAFIDVPGHERFIKNMLAGVGGIDLVLLAIAADESIKPQTREHFEICRLLGIPRGLVALTKADLVDTEILELVRLEVEDFVAGSFLEGAPVVPVSSVTGAGLDRLREELRGLAERVPGKDASRHFRLPVDRSFSMRGFGAVVTGTLLSGSVALEDEVEVHPLGRRARVRGIQVHGGDSRRAFAGQRTALNLAGIDHLELRRGMVLAMPGFFHPATVLDCSIELLASAHPLKHRAPVHFHSGTAEVEAEVRLLESLAPVPPGSRAHVRLLLREPVLLLPGDRFILRMFSPVTTIGGGVVLDIAPPARMRRLDAARRARALAGASARERLALLLKEAPYGLSTTELIARTGWTQVEIEKAVDPGSTVALPQSSSETPPASAARPAVSRWLIDRGRRDALLAAARDQLAAFHKANPLSPGMGREAFRMQALPDAPPFVFDALLAADSQIAAEGETVRRAAHKLALRQDEQSALDNIEAAFARAGLSVPPVGEVLASSGVEPARARSLLQLLLRDKRLVRVSEDLTFHRAALEQLRELVRRHKGEQFTVPAFKDWTGISRKYAIPLLEFLDRERVTRRVGDERVVL